MPKKQLGTDLLFIAQMIGAVIIGGSFFLRALTTIEGQSLTYFIGLEASFVLNLILAWRAHATQSTRITRQAIASYVLWVLLVAADIAAIFLNGTYVWSSPDTLTSIVVVFGSAAVIAVARAKQQSIGAPSVKSGLSVSMKMVPQLFLALKVGMVGVGGVPAASIVAGNATGFLRFGQILFAFMENRADKNRFWLLIAEAGNIVGWGTVSIVWLIKSWQGGVI